MREVSRITKHLKGLDSKLYAVKDERSNVIHVYREGTRLEHFEHNGVKYVYPRTSPHFILALTDTWTANGRPVEWGIEPLMQRMADIDSWNRGRTVDELIARYEKRDAEKDRDRVNMHEAWLRDNRSVFKKAFNEINTSSLNVKEKEKELYGNC